MNLQPVTRRTKDWRLPCGHKRVRVTPTLGTRPHRCTVCHVRYVVTVQTPPGGHLNAVQVVIEPARQEVPA